MSCLLAHPLTPLLHRICWEIHETKGQHQEQKYCCMSASSLCASSLGGHHNAITLKLLAHNITNVILMLFDFTFICSVKYNISSQRIATLDYLLALDYFGNVYSVFELQLSLGHRCYDLIAFLTSHMRNY